jgi:uncharacterized iron-regulated membrane protein
MKNPFVFFLTREYLPTFPETKKVQNPVSKKGWNLPKKLYQWHRLIGIFTVVPVILWTLSGLMHPFMAHWFKPKIAREFIAPQPIPKESITLSPQEILDKHNIVLFKQIQLLQMQGDAYYQVKTMGNQWRYFHAKTGEELKEGDRIYAEYLARYFADDQKSAIKSARLLTSFTNEYKYINRLLPVWKISFDRADGLDVYVETASSRLGTFNTNSRKVFLWIFDTFHNWSFVQAISNNTVRIVVMVILLGIIIVAAVSGLLIYGLFWKRFRSAPAPHNQQGILRRYHRQIGIATAFVTLAFAGSGAYHAWRKLNPNLLPQMVVQPDFERGELVTEANALPVDMGQLVNFSLAKIGKEAYYRVVLAATEDGPAAVRYFSAATGTELPNADLVYAKQLVKKFAQMESMAAAGKAISCCETDGEEIISSTNQAALLSAETLTKFTKEYGFIFKRLPVVRLVYDTPQKTTYYVETLTGHLAAKIENADRAEGISFAIFHKYFLMDWAGKTVRDLVMMFSAFGVLMVSLSGLWVFLRASKKL